MRLRHPTVFLYVRGATGSTQLLQLSDASKSPSSMIVSTGQLRWVAECPFTTFDLGPIS